MMDHSGWREESDTDEAQPGVQTLPDEGPGAQALEVFGRRRAARRR